MMVGLIMISNSLVSTFIIDEEGWVQILKIREHMDLFMLLYDNDVS